MLDLLENLSFELNLRPPSLYIHVHAVHAHMRNMSDHCLLLCLVDFVSDAAATVTTTKKRGENPSVRSTPRLLTGLVPFIKVTRKNSQSFYVASHELS